MFIPSLNLTTSKNLYLFDTKDEILTQIYLNNTILLFIIRKIKKPQQHSNHCGFDNTNQTTEYYSTKTTLMQTNYITLSININLTVSR